MCQYSQAELSRYTGKSCGQSQVLEVQFLDDGSYDSIWASYRCQSDQCWDYLRVTVFLIEP
ncbi:unnamed protein product [Cyberlindnera jadinii]|uniref:Uncharacterized protein n=1 Tax=Cyberlindnera jadinii (strain ATCC 18201 / CBS 1600 / BCRC 20928 / JCM 3617 / NBRC 0987 / NRRL Y-1542) TaxID=983966 RepID=A0A0H5C028_CYBJN|nr:unnamed protein product [Cyberlindnera jadinii]